jgi:hypothetical protein
MSLDIHDKKYIEDVLDRTRLSFRSDMEHFFGVLRDDFNHKFSILVEITKDKPNREESRIIARDESEQVFRQQLDRVVVPCVKEAVESAIGPRYTNHEKRIYKLEVATS